MSDTNYTERTEHDTKLWQSHSAGTKNKTISKDLERKICKKGKTENMDIKSTTKGYVNKNNQRNNGKTNKTGTDYGQWFYEMECLNCGHKYKANGSDIWLRKCPRCQGGKP